MHRTWEDMASEFGSFNPRKGREMHQQPIIDSTAQVARFNPHKGREMHQPCAYAHGFFFGFNPRKGREMHLKMDSIILIFL